MAKCFAYIHFDIYNNKQSRIFWLNKVFIDYNLDCLIYKIINNDLFNKMRSLLLVETMFDNQSECYYIKVIEKPTNDSLKEFNTKLNKLILLK